jgi:predicted nucleic acid-binding protein
MDNFDLRKYLVENKVTTNSKMMNEAEPTFTLNYNTDPDDLKYIENMLSKKGIPAKVSQGTFDDEVEVTVDKKYLKKAEKALKDEGFDV